MVKNIHSKVEKVELIKVNKSTSHINILYKLLKKRSINENISHTSLPNYKEHRLFVNANPYRYWFLIFSSKTFWEPKQSRLALQDPKKIGA